MLAAASLCACAAPAPAAQQPLSAQAPSVRVMTYNLNYGLSGDREGIDAVAAGDADLVLLQEVTPGWQRAIEAHLADRYPHRHYAVDRAAGGLGVLSRVPVQVTIIENPVSWFPAMLVCAETPIGEWQLLNLHLRPPFSDSGSIVSGYFTTGPIREAELDHFLRQLAPGIPTLVAGDLNERDGAASRLLRGRGMVDAIASTAGSGHTWRWQTRLVEVRQALDHIYFEPGLLALQGASVLDRGRSDHLPAVAELSAR